MHRSGARAYLIEHGTLADCPYIDREDLEPCTEIYIEGLPTVHADDESWADDDGHWTPDDAIALYPPDLDDVYDIPDAPDFAATQQPGYWEALERDGILPALSGGSPDPEPTPFVPSDEDWADYRMWTEMFDARDDERRHDDELGLMAAGLPVG